MITVYISLLVDMGVPMQYINLGNFSCTVFLKSFAT